MTRNTERCDRCEERFSELFPTTHGWVCEDCAWAVSERDGEGEVFAELASLYYTRNDYPRLEQAPEQETQAQVQQGQQ